MSAEYKRIDIEHWNGPMTVVGYPDLSAAKYLAQPTGRTEKPVVSKPLAEHIRRQPKPHA